MNDFSYDGTSKLPSSQI